MEQIKPFIRLNEKETIPSFSFPLSSFFIAMNDAFLFMKVLFRRLDDKGIHPWLLNKDFHLGHPLLIFRQGMIKKCKYHHISDTSPVSSSEYCFEKMVCFNKVFSGTNWFRFRLVLGGQSLGGRERVKWSCLLGIGMKKEEEEEQEVWERPQQKKKKNKLAGGNSDFKRKQPTSSSHSSDPEKREKCERGLGSGLIIGGLRDCLVFNERHTCGLTLDDVKIYSLSNIVTFDESATVNDHGQKGSSHCYLGSC